MTGDGGVDVRVDVFVFDFFRDSVEIVLNRLAAKVARRTLLARYDRHGISLLAARGGLRCVR
jgi:hypothetical protein